MPITRLLRGPRRVGDTGHAIICVGLDLEAKIALAQFETDVWATSDTEFPDIMNRAIETGCRGIVSFGVAGGLTSQVRSGDVVIGSSVVGHNEAFATDDIWSSWLLSAISNASYARIAGVNSAVVGASARNELGSRSGAIAVDTESHAVARIATRHLLRFVAVRIIIDAAHRRVPTAALRCVSHDGTASVSRLGRELMGRPIDVMDVIRLWADWTAARKALVTSCHALGASVAGIRL